MPEKLLRIENLHVTYSSEIADVYAVNGVSLELGCGETLGLVGETGAGKTTTVKAIMKLLSEGVGEITQGEIYLEDINMRTCSEKQACTLRGKTVSMIFQDPMSALNPVYTVGDQILEGLRTHNPNASTKELQKRVDEMMELVGIPAERKNEYPHEFSGGMKHRIVIAIALACEPKLILADEPTTALDVTIQAQMLALIRDLQRRMNTAMILITHDFGVVGQTCERVAVMYGGEIVESGKVEQIFRADKLHPYTRGLLNAIPKLDQDFRRLETIDGMVPDPTVKIVGCPFADRCKHTTARCRQPQTEIEVEPGHIIKCCLFDPHPEA